MSIPIGIDLGTSTSIITAFEYGMCKSYKDNSAANPSEIVPSVVAYDPQTGESKVGDLAEDYPDCIREAKRKMGKEGNEALCSSGGKNLKPEEVSAIILKHLKSIAEEQMFGDTVTDVVLTVPAIFSNKARSATKTAGQLAGLNITQLINEPVAAAIYYADMAREKWKGNKTLFVFDFGGGTLDFSVCNKIGQMINFVCNGGDPQLGGKDIDEMFIAYIKNRFLREKPTARISDTQSAMAMLKREVVKCKKALSRSENARLFIGGFATDFGRPVDLDMNIRRSEFDEEVLRHSPISGKESIVDRIIKSLDNLFIQNSDKTKKSDIDYLLFVGGSSYIPLIQKTVQEYLGTPKDSVFCKEPNLAVSHGAAIFAANQAVLTAEDPETMGIQLGITEERRLDVMAVSPHGIGCEILDSDTGKNMYSQWFPPQQEIPFEGSFDYKLISPNQTSLRMGVYQSMLDKDHQPIEDTEFTGCENQMNNIPPSNDGTCRPIKVFVSYDESGLLFATITIPSTGQTMELSYSEKASASMASKKRIDEFTKK